jgi:hypothetical protein
VRPRHDRKPPLVEITRSARSRALAQPGAPLAPSTLSTAPLAPLSPLAPLARHVQAGLLDSIGSSSRSPHSFHEPV